MPEFDFLESLQATIEKRVDLLRFELPLTFIRTSNGYVTRHGGYHIRKKSNRNFEVTWLKTVDNPVWLGTVSNLKLAKAVCSSHCEEQDA